MNRTYRNTMSGHLKPRQTTIFDVQEAAADAIPAYLFQMVNCFTCEGAIISGATNQ
jgi:hypothetical protein